MKEIVLFLLAAAAILVMAWYLARRSRYRGEKRVLREQVQTWEDEGGNVPDVPTVGPRTPQGKEK
ncbi:MAG TPA: hypothetical protein VEW72_05240 [Burkholderiales bacterium]|nr:hypothetical protein [Burkholderiales bacterium]